MAEYITITGVQVGAEFIFDKPTRMYSGDTMEIHFQVNGAGIIIKAIKILSTKEQQERTDGTTE